MLTPYYNLQLYTHSGTSYSNSSGVKARLQEPFKEPYSNHVGS